MPWQRDDQPVWLLIQVVQRWFFRRGFDLGDGFADDAGFVGGETTGEVFFLVFDIVERFLKAGKSTLGVGTIGFDHLHDRADTFFAGVLFLSAGMVGEEFDSFADVVFGKEFEAACLNAVGKHDSAGSGSDDGFMNCGEERFEFFVGEVSVDR